MLDISKRLVVGLSQSAMKLDTNVGPLHNELCDWMYKSWCCLPTKARMIRAGWERMVLLDAWDTQTQLKVVQTNLKTPLFPPSFLVEMEDDED